MLYIIRLYVIVENILLKLYSIIINGKVINSKGNIRIYGFCIDLVIPENLNIGTNCAINGNVYINSTYPIFIGDNVAISESVKLITVSLDYNIKQMNESHVGEQIKIGSNVQIGAGSIILPGVNIGDNIIVGAGAVVTKDVPSNSIIVGNPARIIKSINKFIDEK